MTEASISALAALAFTKFSAAESTCVLEAEDGLSAHGLCARVCRGRNESCFTSLHPDGVDFRPIIWIVAEDGIKMLLGGAGGRRSLPARLRNLGLQDEWISRKLQGGECFRLALFPADDAEPATWDGVVRIVRRTYPEISYKVEQSIPELRSTPFAQIEARAQQGFLNGARYFEINEMEREERSADPRFIDAARLAAREGTLEEVRGFLYFVLGCSELFDGGGRTKHADGSLVVLEYLTRNRKVSEFGGRFAWIELPLEMSDLEGS
jgi:hypothetical protein